MKKNKKRKAAGRLLAAALCGICLTNTAGLQTVEAAGPEKVFQVRTKGIEDPDKKGGESAGDYVLYSDCYFYQQTRETVNPPVLMPPVLYQVTDAYRYDRNVRKRVMDLKSVADGSARQILLPDVAFISAAVGGKYSDFKNGQGLTPVSEAEVNTWKLTIKNPYDEKTNPHGMKAPEISNIRRQGAAVCFDYKNLYNTGNCYLSAVVLSRYEDEIIAYDRIVDASEQGAGTAVINWEGDYDRNNCVLKVFAEKYNGDNMTDYISDIQYIYRGNAPDKDLD